MTKQVIVYHGEYGCETGCCGHAVWLTEQDGKTIRQSWTFAHPDNDDDLEFAKQIITEAFGAEHVADLDWENCLVRNW